MKLTNPIGREVSTGTEAHFAIAPRACRCNFDEGDSEVSYQGAKGGDGCFHCGCSCKPSSWEDLTGNNDLSAALTFRKSRD